MDGSEYLDAILAELRRGRRQWRRGDKILSAFGYARRRQTAIDLINEELASRGMDTVPVLSTSMPLDQAFRFVLTNSAIDVQDELPDEDEHRDEGHVEVLVVAASTEQSAAHPHAQAPTPATVTVFTEAPIVDLDESAERTLIVGNLECAERVPLIIAPSASVQEALTVMDLRDYSQLVVGTGERSIKGIVSHKSIARAFLHASPETVADCLDTSVPRVERNEPLLGVIDRFREYDAVLVFGPDKTISGIVTPADIANEFGAMAGPFLIVGQIEEQLRWLARNLDLKVAMAGAGVINDTATKMNELTMGELQRILENPVNWAKVGIKYDRATFCKELGAVRDIRNAVMHFRDSPDAAAFKRMRDFAAIVQRTYIALRK